MKRRFIILITSLFSVLVVMAEKYTIEFSADEFRFESENSCMSVLPADNFKYFYLEGDSFPSLPMYMVSVLLEPDQTVADYSFTELSQSVLYDNITLATAPTPIPASQIGNTPYTGPKPYLGASFPTTVLEYSDMGECKGNRTAYFAVSPFKYDVATKTLSLVTKIELTVTTTFKAMELPYHPMDKAMTKALINPELNDRIVERYNAKKEKEQGQDKAVASGNDFDYLIITNDLLKPAFEPLKTWKNKKGVRTEIVTINQIVAGNSSDPLYLAIKKYIRDCYVNRNVKYVLLGGDQTVIPAVYCKAPVGGHSPTIPADMFYATLVAPLNWDGNNNGILGEIDDDIDLAPEVYLSRISVNNLTNANNIVHKIINYETNPNLEYINRLLLSGVILDEEEGMTPDDKSDAEIKSEVMYRDYIQPYWSGIKHRLYDTNTDFGGAGYDVTAQHLSDVLNQGYHFMHMMTHGAINHWGLECEPRFYSSDALNLQNTGKYINVVSNSCMINWFDNDMECLTEAFMNNPEGGAISIFASSREGWYSYPMNKLFDSNLYNATYFKYLFDEKICHFAELTTSTKISFLDKSQNNNSNRWLQFSLNAMGDPEMPIYTDVPNVFNNVKISSGSNAMTIYTGVPGCTIAITDCSNVYTGNYYQVFKNTDHAVLYNLPKSFDIVITKHNYIPYQQHIDIDCLFIQKETITTTKTVSKSVEIGYDVTNSKPQGDVVVKNNGKLKIENADYVLIKNGFTVELGGELEVKP